MQLLSRKVTILRWATLLSLKFFKDVNIFYTRHLLRESFDLAFLPRPGGPSCPVLARIPSALGFKPLRAFFPSNRGFKAECVWKAVFGEGSELDRNRYEKRSGCFRRRIFDVTFRCPTTTAPMKAFKTGKDTGLLCLGCCSRLLFARIGHAGAKL